MSEERIKQIISLFEDGYCEKCNEFNCLYGSTEEVVKALRQLQQENQELKKQLEEVDYTVIPNSDIKPLIDKHKTQQKEFIKYLEDEIDKISKQIKNYDIWHEVGTDINFLIIKKQFNIEILQKYKEIIGDDKE